MPTRNAPRVRRLGVERLESRRLLAAVLWDGEAGDGLWHSPQNWDGDQVPMPGDEVTITDIDVIEIDQPAEVRSITLDQSTLVVRETTVEVQSHLKLLEGASTLHLVDSRLAGDLVIGEEAAAHAVGVVTVDGNVLSDGMLFTLGRNDLPPRLQINGELVSSSFTGLNGTQTAGTNELTVSGGIRLASTAVLRVGRAIDADAIIYASIEGQAHLVIDADTQIVGDVTDVIKIDVRRPLHVTGDLVTPDAYLTFGIDREATGSDGESPLWSVLTIDGVADVRGVIDLDLDGSASPEVEHVLPLIESGEARFELASFEIESEILELTGYTLVKVGSTLGYLSAGPADLQLLQVSVSDPITIQQAATVSWDVRRTGGLFVSSDWVDNVYLSDDAVLDLADRRVARKPILRRHVGLSETYSAEATFDWPADYSQASYVIVVVNDGPPATPDLNPENNRRVVQVFPQSDVDLSVTEVVTPPQVHSESLMSVHWAVATSGDDAIPKQPAVQLFMSLDQTIDSADQPLFLNNHQIWRSTDREYRMSAQVNVDATPGNYFVLVRVNGTGHVYETSADNNVTAAPIAVLPTVNTSISQFLVPAQLKLDARHDVAVAIEVPHNDPGTSRWNGEIHLVGVGTSILLKTFDLPRVAGRVASESVEIRIPGNVQSGRYELRIRESGRPEVAVSVNVEVVVPQASVRDLRLVVDENDGLISSEFDVEVSSAMALEHRLYFSEDPWFDPFDRLLGSVDKFYPQVGTQRVAFSAIDTVGQAVDGFAILVTEASDHTTVNVAGEGLVTPLRLPEASSVEGPDFSVKRLNVTRGIETPLEVSFLVTNSTSRSSFHNRVYFFATTDPTTLVAGTPFYSTRVSMLSASVRDVMITLPTSLLPESLRRSSELTLFAVSSKEGVPEGDLSAFAAVTDASIDAPDLVVIDSQVPDPLFPDSTFQLTLENRSIVESPAGRVDRVYFSEDDQLDKDDRLLQTKTIADPLPTGERSAQEYSLDGIQIDAEAGYLIVDLGTHHVDEDVMNNTHVIRVERIAQPRLDFASVNGPIELTLGQNLVTLTAKNVGNVDRFSGDIRTLVSDEPSLPDDAVGEASRHHSLTVLPGETVGVTPHVQVNASDLGSRFLYVRAEGVGNEWQRLDLARPVTAPDLQVTALRLPDAIDWTQPFDVDVEAVNVGSVTLGTQSWRDEIYYSRDAILSGDDVIIDSEVSVHFPVAPGETGLHRSSIDPSRLPVEAFAGPGFLIAKRLPVGGLDSDESDNVISVAVAPEAIDLSISVDDFPDVFRLGEPNTLMLRIHNEGPATLPPGQWRAEVTVALHGDSDDARHPRYGVRSLRPRIDIDSPILPGHSELFEVLIPEVTPPLSDVDLSDLRLAEVSVELYWQGNHPEIERANNFIDLTIPRLEVPLPDLAIEDFEIAVVDAGSSAVEISWVVRNIGNAIYEHEARYTLWGEGDTLTRVTALSLLPGEAVAVSQTVTIDPAELYDDFDVYLTYGTSGIAEIYSQNNTAATSLVASAEFMPRPVTDSLTFVDGNLRWLICNDGPFPFAFSDRYGADEPVIYLSPSTLPGPADSQHIRPSLGDLGPPLQPGESRWVELRLEVDAERNRFEKLYARAVVNPPRYLTLSEERMAERRSDVISVSVDRPTLSWPGLDLPSNAVGGGSVSASFELTNESGQPQQGWEIVVDVGGDSMRYPFDQIVRPGETVSGSVDLPLPEGTDEELIVSSYLSYRLSVAPGAEAVTEVTAAVEQSLRIAPFGLSVTDISVSPGSQGPASYRVDWSVASGGRGRSDFGGWSDAVYYSSDNQFDASDRRIATIATGPQAFDPDGTYRNSKEVILPFVISDGPGYFIVVADVAEERADSDRADNRRSVRFDATASRLRVDLPDSEDSGVSDVDDVTNVASPKIEVLVPRDGVLLIDLDGDRRSDLVRFVNQGEVVVVSPATDFAEGAHRITATLNSPDLSESAELVLTVDQTAPQLLTAGTIKARIPRSLVKLSFSEEVDVAPGAFTLSGRQFGVASGESLGTMFAMDVASFNEYPGTYRVEATGAITDLAGNRLENESVAPRFELELSRTLCSFGNPNDANDVNGDGLVTVLDALLVINTLGRINLGSYGEFGFPVHDVDVDCSRRVTALDALRVINQLRRDADAPPSPESVRGVSASAPIAFVSAAENRSSIDVADDRREHVTPLVSADLSGEPIEKTLTRPPRWTPDAPWRIVQNEPRSTRVTESPDDHSVASGKALTADSVDRWMKSIDAFSKGHGSVDHN